jgi:hypothetical protein
MTTPTPPEPRTRYTTNEAEIGTTDPDGTRVVRRVATLGGADPHTAYHLRANLPMPSTSCPTCWQAWGEGLPAPGTTRPINPVFRVAWIAWCVLWLLVWLTVGWLVFPWNLPAAAVSAALTAIVVR